MSKRDAATLRFFPASLSEWTQRSRPRAEAEHNQKPHLIAQKALRSRVRGNKSRSGCGRFGAKVGHPGKKDYSAAL
jgi:hypothetical protein